MSEIFPIHAASGRPGSLVLLFVLGLVALFLFIGYSARATRYVVSEEGVAIQRTLYGRALGWDELVTEEARLVDLDGTPELQPVLRTNGIGLPGYRAGWFRLRGGGRALLFLTRSEGVVAVPTTGGFTLLLSPADPEGFLAALQRRSR